MRSLGMALPARSRWLLPALLVVAFALRVFGVDWDQGHLFHPDERYIIMTTEGVRLPFPIDPGLLLSVDSPLNPHGFAYASFIYYQLHLLQPVVGTIARLFRPGPSTSH